MVVTRAPEQARELVAQLEALGAEVLLLPTVSFADPEDWAPLDKALRGLASFDWVLLTSQNAVRYVCKRARALGVATNSAASDQPRFAAVGPATARAAKEEGLAVAFVATVFRGEALAGEMKGQLAGRRVLLPRSDRARSDLPAALRAAGAEVVEVVAYRTVALEAANSAALEHLRAGSVDVVAFASPSAFHHLAEELGSDGLERLASRAAFAAIGPVTAKAISEAGYAVAIEAGESTSAGMAAAIAGHFAAQSSAPVRGQAGPLRG